MSPADGRLSLRNASWCEILLLPVSSKRGDFCQQLIEMLRDPSELITGELQMVSHEAELLFVLLAFKPQSDFVRFILEQFAKLVE
jgi:hypothetical protein